MPDQPSTPKLVQGIDYTIDPVTGFLVFTASYLLKRGYCCGNGCRHCPYPPDVQEKAGRAKKDQPL